MSTQASSSSGSSRREFLKKGSTAGLASLAFPTIISSSALGLNGAVAPSNRITMAFIGVGNQGTNDMRGFLRDERVQVVAVCDPNRESAGYWSGAVAGRDPAKRIVEQHYAEKKPSGNYKGCDAIEDFREVLGRADIDAVEIATPDHWHTIPVIMAARAGKDIYCQKPLSLTIYEGRMMSDAIKRYDRVFQTGSQQRSGRRFLHACELVRNGRIGKLQRVTCGLPSGRPDYGKTADRKSPEPVPAGFNYDLWLGPAPEAPYSPARTHVNFRWIFDYSGGQVTDWGGHHPDIAQWGMGTTKTGPVAIKNAKGEFPEDPIWNTATQYEFDAIYENGVVMTVTSKMKEGNGVRFEGTDGWVFVNRGTIDAGDPKLLEEKFGAGDIRLKQSTDHFRNFIDCVISREEPIAPCEEAHRSISICHLGNISMLLGRDLKWDPKNEQIHGDAAAQWMLNRPYRKPWSLESLV